MSWQDVRIVVSFASDIGECPDGFTQVCGTVRVTMPTKCNVTLDVLAANGHRPQLEAWEGDIHGNPITVPADSGNELEIRIVLRSGAPNVESFEGQSFEVTTSVAPFQSQ